MTKRILSIMSTVTVSIALCASTSFAAGFRLPETSNSAMGMASAFVGQADDASAVWYNPAAITQLKGTQIMGGVVAIYPYISHDTATTTEVSERDIHLPVHFFATHKMSDQMSFGLSINNPFGLATDWDPNSSTRYVATFSKVVTTEINPNVAYKLNDTVSVAAGVAFIHLRTTLERLLPPGINLRLNGDGDGWGANAAVHYRPSDSMHFGLSYRSRIKVDVDGNAEVPAGPQYGSVSTSITLPDMIQIGSSFKVSDNLLLNADLDYTMWSTYDRIVISSSNALFNSTEEKQWEDVWCLRIGGQYKLSDQWKVRGGYLYDNNPVQEKYFETRVPDSDRQGLTAGVGFSSGPVAVDAAYLYLRFNDRTINDSGADDGTLTPTALNGNYKSLAHLLGVSVSYKF